ncbi:glycoside hydrolase family 36 protein [Kribbella italica]|uniref:Alpha-galactosidase n=1 Tax=Kribbella italica TaxID=1540520 RepID=A0A7W9MTG8_9ACTN|nr:alpha-galactosidase [Kribbella italica]MBB5835786.1 alpha-galactosidase [Kribbella italica]
MTLAWQTPNFTLTFAVDDGPVRLAGWRPATGSEVALGTDQPLVEISAIGHGRSPGTVRHVGTQIGHRLRYVGAEPTDTSLRIEQYDETTGLRVISCFAAGAGLRAWTEVKLSAPGRLELDFVSSLAVGLPSLDATLVAADNDWMAENRWNRRPLRSRLADIRSDTYRPLAKHRLAITNAGSWSTGEVLPVGVLVAGDHALGWQIEHNGPWHYELGETRSGGYLLLSGPTDQEHAWTATVTPTQTFTTVPVSLVAAPDEASAFVALTAQRRAIRLRRPVDDRLPVVFNDYMNTLMGDPTTAKLFPLIDAAADAGADYFCIDAGWYAEGDWWSTVGAWQPSPSRFPDGLGEVVGRIKQRGMVPGLWLEPEVVGVDSPLAAELPDGAFLTRRGVRVAEHGRYLLDLRSDAARAHLNSTVDRLIEQFGIGFFKLDNNTMTGPGTDKSGTSLGQGLLEHNRAHLRWLDEVQARHPELLLENCASGAMRMDYALLSRLHLQSTSDQQDHLLYAPIAAAAPASILPEQAGNWAYPQTGTSTEELVFSLVNGILGRLYLSGHLDRFTAEELDLVKAAVTAHREILPRLDQLEPFWPLGLPGWSDDWIMLGLRDRTTAYLSIWHRGQGPASIRIPWSGSTPAVLFPSTSQGWTFTKQSEELLVETAVSEPSARVLTWQD